MKASWMKVLKTLKRSIDAPVVGGEPFSVWFLDLPMMCQSSLGLSAAHVNVNEPKLWLYNGECGSIDSTMRAFERIRSSFCEDTRDLIGRFPIELKSVLSKFKATMLLGTIRLKLALRVD